MFTRKREYGLVTIEATFQWDSGDPSVGFSAGWGEETCVEITAPFVDGSKIITWIIWRNFARDDDAPSITDTVKVDDPSTWLIEDVQTEYRSASGLSTVLSEWSSSIKRTHLTLSTLPEVLEVVRDAWEDAMASERLESAKEAVSELDSYIGELEYLASHPEDDFGDPSELRHERIASLKGELETARAELEAAQEACKARGM